jgi:hypothetical protein
MEDDTQVLDYESRSIADLQETRADRLRQSATSPDFTPSKIQTMKDVLSESTMQLSDAEREGILRSTGVYASTEKQVSTAIENALIGMNQLPDELTIAYGNIGNYITGGALGEELQNIAYESMAHRYATMASKENAIGGIRSELAQLAGGATSFLQLALEGIATAGVLPNVHMGIQAFGEGTYNDMKAYADKHNGSLEGYKPSGIDLAVNTANALLQVYIENRWGVGSPRFFVGASRGLIEEGLSGALQEAAQGALSDLAEAVKGNEDISILLENADQYARDAVIGGILQGAMGAATYHQNYAKATNNVANAIAKVRGHEAPTVEDQQQAEAIIDAKERQYASALTTEFKAVFDASTGEGKLQQNILAALKKATEAQELDLGTADETEMAQKLEQIATQETLNAMEMAREQGKSVAEMELNNIVYRDGSIYLEGYTPEIGERSVDRARVLAERQSGLAEVQMKLDGIKQEIQQTKKELAEAKAQSKQALADKLQARLEKQNALAEKRRIQAEKLKVQTEKIQKQIAKELGEAPKTVEEPKEPAAPMAKVAERSKKYKGEKKSLKEERATKTPEQQFLFQSGLDNGQNGTTITGQGGGNARAEQKARTKEIVNSIRRRMRGRPDASVWVDTSTGDSGVKQTPGIRSVNLSQADQKALNDQGVSTPNFTVYDDAKAGAQEFLTAMQNAVAELGDQAASVDIKELSDYENMKTLILSEDKKTGCAITKDGDIVSLFSSSEERGRTIPMLLLAVQNGGTKLDCFDIYLPGIYSKVGFKAVARNNWVEKYKPDGWNKDYFSKYNNGEPDVVFMIYDPNNVAEYNRGDGKLIKSGDVDADYGLGMQAQDEALAELALQETQAQQNAMMAAFRPNQMLRQEETSENLNQSKVEGTGSDKYRGGYDEQLKRIVLGEKSDLTTIQHEFAHYWIQNNFKWARSGLASQEWLRKWRDVEEWLGIEPQDRLLSRQASEKFARAYERYIMEGKVSEDLQWAFDGFQKFYQNTYEDLENEYFDLSEELDPAIVDWFNRQRPATEESLKTQAYKTVAQAAMAEGAEIITETGNGDYVVSSMNEKGEVVSDVVVTDAQSQDSQLAVFSDKKKNRRVTEGLKASNPEIQSDKYNVLNRAETVEQAQNWIARDRAGAWAALNDPKTNPIDRTALFQAFKNEAENGDYALGAELAGIKFPKEMTELGQAISVLGERPEFDPLTILEEKQKSLGEPTTEEMAAQTNEMGLDADLDAAQVKDLEETTECVL